MVPEVNERIVELKKEARPVHRLASDLLESAGFVTGWHLARAAALQCNAGQKLEEIERLKGESLLQAYIPDLLDVRQQAMLPEVEPETLRNILQDLTLLSEVATLEVDWLRSASHHTALPATVNAMAQNAQKVNLDLSAWEYVLSDHLFELASED